ncbi:MAG: glycosyltransferase family 2 protein [Gammaproteobacteria bacterium]|nr:glycosyltransferase family 2 protein [Gammaproteobacteria bacterium]
MPAETPHVTILLGLYNGAANLGEQLGSFAAQSHDNWSLIVSDDGSDDAGPDMVRSFARAHPGRDITLQRGPHTGFVRNFLSLLRAAGPDVPCAALSDQDDIWLADKLARAVTALRNVPAITPGLYCSRTLICDAAGQTAGRSLLFSRPPGFGNALVQNIAGGNTMVMNRAALDLLQSASLLAGDAVCHDWWIYQMVSGAGGVVIYDPEPSLKYRQHAGNLIGANTTTLASLSRLHLLMKGEFQGWNNRNIATLEACVRWLDPGNRKLLAAFAEARRRGPLGRLWGLSRAGVYRQTNKGNLGLWLAALLGKI